jgi:guanyl-specific ribonuclease Sa
VTDEREHEDAPRVARPPEAVAELPGLLDSTPAVTPAAPLAGRGYGAASVLALQRSVGNQAVQRLLRTTGTSGPILQRLVAKSGGKGAVAIPSKARTVAKYVMTRTSVQPGGSNHIADIQNHGFPGFKMYTDEYAGGEEFKNYAQPDHNKLPYMGGQTYQEWDIHPCVVGQNRGPDRIVTSSDGKVYFTNDHYKNFTEFTP